MKKNDCLRELGIMLDAEIAHTKAMLALLERESGLSSRESQSLIEISEQKNCLLKKIEGCYKNRTSFIKQAGYGANQQGVEACIAWCDEKGELQKKWLYYRDQVKKCRTLNQLNGSVMDASLRVVKQALSVLYGQQVNEQTYGANGRAEGANIGRTIAKA